MEKSYIENLKKETLHTYLRYRVESLERNVPSDSYERCFVAGAMRELRDVISFVDAIL